MRLQAHCAGCYAFRYRRVPNSGPKGWHTKNHGSNVRYGVQISYSSAGEEREEAGKNKKSSTSAAADITNPLVMCQRSDGPRFNVYRYVPNYPALWARFSEQRFERRTDSVRQLVECIPEIAVFANFRVVPCNDWTLLRSTTVKTILLQ